MRIFLYQIAQFCYHEKLRTEAFAWRNFWDFILYLLWKHFIEPVRYIFSAFLSMSSTLHKSLMWVTVMKPIVHGWVDYREHSTSSISLSVMQNNCLLFAESNLEKLMQRSTEKCHTLSKLENESKNYCCFKV